MATIVIKDLKESVDLDRKAMREIAGGWSRRRFNRISAPSVLSRKRTFFDVFTFDVNLNKP